MSKFAIPVRVPNKILLTLKPIVVFVTVFRTQKHIITIVIGVKCEIMAGAEIIDNFIICSPNYCASNKFHFPTFETFKFYMPEGQWRRRLIDLFIIFEAY